jgi:hypothetical protein
MIRVFAVSLAVYFLLPKKKHALSFSAISQPIISSYTDGSW